MTIVIHAKESRGSLPEVVEGVRRGVRFTVQHRSRPAFESIPVETAPIVPGDLANDRPRS